MSYLLPRSFFSFPSLPSMLDDEDWGMMTNTPSGLSVAEDATHVYVEAAVPGIQDKEIDITFEKGLLRVVAEAKQEEKEGKKFFRRSQKYFSYQLAVPGDIDAGIEPETDLAHGLLRITFTKAAKAQPKKLTVKTSEK